MGISIYEPSFDTGLESPGAGEDPGGNKSQAAVVPAAAHAPAQFCNLVSCSMGDVGQKTSTQQIFSSTGQGRDWELEHPKRSVWEWQ